MQSHRTIILTLGAALACATLQLAGCDKKAAAPASQPGGGASSGHSHADGHDHDHADSHSHGARTELGEQTVSGVSVRASRDGDFKPGGDAPIFVETAGAPAVNAVRFWIGAQDARGSVKARAEREGGGWHSHVQIPNPLPDGSKLWVEIEQEGGQKAVAGFELKR